MTPPSQRALPDRLLALRQVAIDHFREDDWKIVSSLTATEDIIQSYGPELGKLNWGEDAYEVLTLRVLEQIAARGLENLAIVEDYGAECVDRQGQFSQRSLKRVNLSKRFRQA